MPYRRYMMEGEMAEGGEWITVPDRVGRRMVEQAREFRRSPTRSEAKLWEALRDGQLGMKFRRQQPIGPFVVDFCCRSRQLIVGVDGPIHDEEEDRDHERQALLEGSGYSVLCFSAELVERNLESVLTQITEALA